MTDSSQDLDTNLAMSKQLLNRLQNALAETKKTKKKNKKKDKVFVGARLRLCRQYWLNFVRTRDYRPRSIPRRKRTRYGKRYYTYLAKILTPTHPPTHTGKEEEEEKE